MIKDLYIAYLYNLSCKIQLNLQTQEQLRLLDSLFIQVDLMHMYESIKPLFYSLVV